MKNLRRNFERYCFANRNQGIPNLMLYITLGNAVVYLITMFTGNAILYNLLCFSRAYILRGQIWRLITYPLTLMNSNILFMLITLLCYYSLGSAMERQWGTLKFNIFYFTGMVLMDVFGMVTGYPASVYYLNMSLFLGFATLYPDSGFLLFFIIPVKAWLFALVDLAIIFLGVFTPPYSIGNLFPLVALGNYFLFFGKDVLNVVPLSWQNWLRRLFKKKPKAAPQPKIIHFKVDNPPKQEKVYTHRCTVCGKTDVSDPDMEFRYCSKCNGYYCYCSDHINNHTHIQ